MYACSDYIPLVCAAKCACFSLEFFEWLELFDRLQSIEEFLALRKFRTWQRPHSHSKDLRISGQLQLRLHSSYTFTCHNINMQDRREVKDRIAKKGSKWEIKEEKEEGRSWERNNLSACSAWVSRFCLKGLLFHSRQAAYYLLYAYAIERYFQLWHANTAAK